ncbi:MarR family winged helix-turn-helix transcriptional regulator [Raoultibacter phocaeensis]|uniref:MarR family winged helix-turn-helix transcriptional regulator n=1 Tax=Raoultibacter phocaeensis TaxID=2479841 RepID=UPI0011188055|nr:MarR family transcriptional regulator [Raoultibacter phocaeensis]
MADIPKETKQGLLDIMRRFHKNSYVPFVTPEGLTFSESRVVLGIYTAQLEGEHTVQPRFLAERMRMTPSALSQTLKLLEEKGYVERHRVSDDFRAVSLELTDQGERLARQAEAMREQHLNDLVEYVGADDIDHLIATLHKVLDFHERQAESGRIERLEHHHCARTTR